MARLPAQWVVPTDSGWWVRKEWSSRLTTRTDTKAQAVATATRIAKNQGTELIIQKKGWQIQERNTYGKDPFPPRG